MYKQKKIKLKKLPETIKILVFSSANNVRIDITHENGDVIYWKTAGTENFKNSKKSTPLAAFRVANEICKLALTNTVRNVIIEVSGIGGGGRDAALKTIFDSKLPIYSIAERIKIPHNGTRPKKRRK